MENAVYVCPMHPDIKETSPGVCPKCGMKLEQEKTAPGPGPVPRGLAERALTAESR